MLFQKIGLNLHLLSQTYYWHYATKEHFIQYLKVKISYIIGLKDGNDNIMKKASLAAVSFCTFFYILTGLMGYILYGNKVQSNFLLMF